MRLPVRDLQYGLRVLTRSPGFAAAALIALALGIGVTSAVFSAVDAVLVQPLPYENPDRLVWITNLLPKQNRGVVLDAQYISWAKRTQTFEAMAAYNVTNLTLSGVGDAERMEAARVSASFFSLFGVKPLLGRGFLPLEDRPGGPPVVIITQGLWQRHFESTPGILGKAVTLDRNSYTVVGVLPATFEFPGSAKVDLFIPFRLPDAPLAGRTVMFVNVIGRLKRDVTLKGAASELETTNRGLQAGLPVPLARMMSGTKLEVTFLHDRLVANVRPALLILLVAVGFVFMIACANVASLQLARGLARRKEIAIREAIGATFWRLGTQLFLESLLLAGLGATAGLALAWWIVDAVRAFGPKDIRHLQNISINQHVLFVTIGVGVLAGILSALAPTFAARRINLSDSLKEDINRYIRADRLNLLRPMLVVFELVLAVVLLISSSLLIKSFLKLTSVDLGFDPHNLISMQISLASQKYGRSFQQLAFFNELIGRIRSLPDVVAVGAGSGLPFSEVVDIEVEGKAGAPSAGMPRIGLGFVTPDYFRALGVPLKRGRFFGEWDAANGPKIAIINESFGQLVWPGENPLGKRIKVSNGESLSIVGVVGDIKQSRNVEGSAAGIFLPYLQNPGSQMMLLVRSNSDPLSLVSLCRVQSQAIDRDVPAYDISIMEKYLSEALAPQRFYTLLLGIFASAACALAGVGVYGLTSYAVARRTREIGIRLALGAQRTDVLKLVLRQSAGMSLLGISLGLGLAVALTRFLSALLFGVSPTDPGLFTVASLLVGGLVLLASYVPARRATSVDCVSALRSE